MGIDWFITHGAYYTADGLKKHDAPPSFFYQMPWWRNTGVLSRYVRRLNDFLRGGKRRVSVLLLDPVTSTWTEIDKRQERLKEDFAAFQSELLRQGTDYYIMDPQLFAEGKVTKVQEKIYYENCGDAYEIVVLPFMTNLEPEAAEKLKEYMEMGGTVLAAGTVPFRNLEGPGYEDWIGEYIGTDPREMYRAYLAGETLKAETEHGYASSDWRKAAEEVNRLDRKRRKWHITLPEQGLILQIQRMSPNKKEEVFLANTDGKPHEVEIAIGNRKTIRELAGGESLFLDEDLWEGESISGKRELEIRLTEEMQVKAVSPNMLRMGMWDMTLPDGQKGKADSFPLIDQMEEAGMKIPIVQKDYFGCPKELEFPKTHGEYSYGFVSHLKKGTTLYLLIEPGSLLGQWVIKVNGRIYREADFVSYPVYAPSNLGIDITEDIREGENQVKLELSSSFSFGGIRNPLYLCGRFAVEKENEKILLTPEKDKGSMGDLTGCGLPFYGGSVEFTKEIPDEVTAGLKDEETVCIRIKDSNFHESLRIMAGGEILGVCPYAPYKVLVPAKTLRKYGEITLCVDTSLSRLFEGEYFNEDRHKYEKVFDIQL